MSQFTPLSLSFLIAVAFPSLLAHAGALDGSPAGPGLSAGVAPAAAGQATATGRAAHDCDDNGTNHWHKAHHDYQEAQQEPQPDGQPNQHLMEESRHEAHLARMADRQAAAFARDALDALATEAKAQGQNAPPPASPDEVQSLYNIATQPNPNAQQVQDELAKSGYDLGPNDPIYNSPVTKPDFSTASSAGAKANDPNYAGVNGRLPASVQNPQAQGVVVVDGGMQRKLGADGAAGLQDGINSGMGAGDQLNPNAIGSLATNAGGSAGAAGNSKGSAADELHSLRLREYQMRQEGLRAVGGNFSPALTGPIRQKDDDIFQVVHTHYKVLRDNGLFFEAHLPAIAGAPTREQVIETNLQVVDNQSRIRKQMPQAPSVFPKQNPF